MQVSVVIPVGPNPANTRWLDEAVLSVSEQTWAKRPDGGVNLVLVDDMAGLSTHMVPSDLPTTVWLAPWYLGVAHAFNIGVAIAPSELVFMLGSDDWLEADCIERCVEEYKRQRDDLGYYYVGVRYLDTNELQDQACHAAMVTKALWRRTGGFPIQSSSGAPDAALLSILIGNYPRAGRHWKVSQGRPLYNYRRHSETDTASKGPWQGVILSTRDLVTREWTPRQYRAELDDSQVAT
jgi:hypothetical protein